MINNDMYLHGFLDRTGQAQTARADAAGQEGFTELPSGRELHMGCVPGGEVFMHQRPGGQSGQMQGAPIDWSGRWSPVTAPEEGDAVLPTKHSHYFKDVSRLKAVDVYRVLELFAVTDPCLQHAIKKLLVAGGRGAGKNINQDVQEAIDTLERWQSMRAEDARAK